MLGETELVKNLYQKWVGAPAKDCQVTTVQIKSFPQVPLYSYKPSVPPNKVFSQTVGSDQSLWDQCCWDAGLHGATLQDQKKKKKDFTSGLQCKFCAMHSHFITFPQKNDIRYVTTVK